MNSHENFNICLLQNRCKRMNHRAAKTVRFVYFLFTEFYNVKMDNFEEKLNFQAKNSIFELSKSSSKTIFE